ncbi:putative membrane protein [Alkalibacillus flavidus]|uniref:Membrane protein n=1 Tax=Alkalibacillus flavidus TaxID=546021 RepID=A0ABV2KV57_9BACI
MKADKSDELFLRFMSILTLGSLLLLLFRKPPIKDWLVVYLFNATTNTILDNILVSSKILSYPVRFFPKVFNTHILFDFLIYPTFTILYNQMTEKDKLGPIIYKLLYFVVPMLLIETWAAKKTNLIAWKKWWKWYHTLLGFVFKSLITRSVLGLVNKVENKQNNVNNV